MKNQQIVLSILFLLSFQNFVYASDGWIGQGHLTQLLDGNSVQQYNILTGRSSYLYYNSNRELYGENQDGKATYLGKWYIENNGQVCSKNSKLFCSEVSFEGSTYKFWSTHEGKFITYATAKFYKGDKANLMVRYAERVRLDPDRPVVGFVGPDGKVLPGQRQLEGKEADEAVKRGIGQVLDMARDDADYAIACREAGGYSIGRTCYKRY